MIFRPNDRRPARCALLGYTFAVVKCLSARRSTIPGWRWPACCWSGPSSSTPRSPSSAVSAIASLCIGQEACCTTQVLTPRRKERQDDDSLRALRLGVRSSHDSMSLAGTEISRMSSPPTAPTFTNGWSSPVAVIGPSRCCTSGWPPRARSWPLLWTLEAAGSGLAIVLSIPLLCWGVCRGVWRRERTRKPL